MLTLLFINNVQLSITTYKEERLNMGRLHWINLTVVFITAITGVHCLRNVTLEVIPEVVERGHEATLRCHYVLEDSPLYSLKWYRGKHEFYRFSPTETPPIKIFTIPGIIVDANNSNHNQVTIKNVDFALTGNFCCEVTADAPTFSTEYGTKKLVVVSLPTGKPIITTERRRYDPGDTLKANCSVRASKPRVEFSFMLNNMEVGQTNVEEPKEKSEYNMGSNSAHMDESQLQWGELSIGLQPFHYSNGQLHLRCIAQIPGIYRAVNEIHLSAGLREPRPERVTSESSITIYSTCLVIALSFCALHPFLR